MKKVIIIIILMLSFNVYAEEIVTIEELNTAEMNSCIRLGFNCDYDFSQHMKIVAMKLEILINLNCSFIIHIYFVYH